MADISELAARLTNHPDLEKRFEQILNIVDNADGNCVRADDTEFRVIEELRKLGKEVLEDWAQKQQSGLQASLESKGSTVEKKGKKKCIGTQRMGK